jgi:hypothetical protein
MLEAATNAEPAALSVALRSSKESSDKGVVDAYDAAPVATTAERHTAFLAVLIKGKMVGRLDLLMAMHIVG